MASRTPSPQGTGLDPAPVTFGTRRRPCPVRSGDQDLRVEPRRLIGADGPDAMETCSIVPGRGKQGAIGSLSQGDEPGSGRTTMAITCGTRVGLEQRIDIRRTAPPRFVADVMLGHLARWLRTMGYDTVGERDGDDEDLVRQAFTEDRILLTRDRRLPAEWRISNVLLLDEEHPSEQIRTVVDHFALDWGRRLFTRCSRCNEPLERMDPEAVRQRQDGEGGGGPDPSCPSSLTRGARQGNTTRRGVLAPRYRRRAPHPLVPGGDPCVDLPPCSPLSSCFP
jgi:uncharacterized protein